MANIKNIKLVIEIPKEKYLYAKNIVNNGKETNPVVLAIGNGIPLQKDDADAVIEANNKE